MSYAIVATDDYLEHHGILGQKWGVRRYQNKDGSYTTEGANRYRTGKMSSNTKTGLSNIQKKNINNIIKIGAASVGVGIATYGTYKLASTGQLQNAIKIGATAVGKFAKQSPTMAKNAIKQSGKVIVDSTKQAGENFVKGIPQGAGSMGNKLGYVAGGGITLLAAKELIDLTIGENTDKLIMDAYNSYQKKENKVKNP